MPREEHLSGKIKRCDDAERWNGEPRESRPKSTAAHSKQQFQQRPPTITTNSQTPNT
jgi:hypothetical protein